MEMKQKKSWLFAMAALVMLAGAGNVAAMSPNAPNNAKNEKNEKNDEQNPQAKGWWSKLVDTTKNLANKVPGWLPCAVSGVCFGDALNKASQTGKLPLLNVLAGAGAFGLGLFTDSGWKERLGAFATALGGSAIASHVLGRGGNASTVTSRVQVTNHNVTIPPVKPTAVTKKTWKERVEQALKKAKMLCLRYPGILSLPVVILLLISGR
ncbi:MAG: hypothetical protein M1549_03480 [Candidatus Dependentiae bacterium]|nr:hypothetical protein [Candidatus Dependentiae bacterium]